MNAVTEAPIFMNVGHALAVSYLMAILPVTQRVSTQVLIDSLREQLGKAEARMRSNINTGGMSPLEFRGQCAMVTAAAQHHLPAPEYAAVRCRFGHQLTKSDGVQSLADYLKPVSGIDNLLALKAIIWSHYHRGSQRAVDRFSLRGIERETGVTQHKLRVAQEAVREAGPILEARAEDRLSGLFVRTGPVGAA